MVVVDTNAGLMLTHRLWRRIIIKPTLFHLLFTGVTLTTLQTQDIAPTLV